MSLALNKTTIPRFIKCVSEVKKFWEGKAGKAMFSRKYNEAYRCLTHKEECVEALVLLREMLEKIEKESELNESSPPDKNNRKPGKAHRGNKAG